MSRSPQAVKDLDRRLLWHPFTQMQDYEAEEPLVIERAEGTYLIDVDGRRYLDGVSSLWVTLHGHRHPKLDAALKAQVDRLAHSTLLGISNRPAIELAEKLMAVAPPTLKKVFYSDNGSTAVEVALKMAFQYWQQVARRRGKKPAKQRFLKFTNAYHGDTIGSVSAGGIDLFHATYKPLLFETLTATASDTGEEAERMIGEHRDALAAVIIEPRIQGAAGMRLQREGFLPRLRAACDKADVLLIFDEVATGFGRTGKMFACEHEQVWPDILCLAKGLGGGYLPIAATLTTAAIYRGFCGDYKDLKTFFHGHTFTGNPLACAVGIASLEIFEEERVLEKLQPKIRVLSELLAALAEHPHVGEIRQLGFMVGIELVKDKAAKTLYPWEDKIGVKVTLEARKRGVIIRPLGNVIVLMPPLSISEEELRTLAAVVRESIAVITA